ncbi:hypothetical protein [Burkholderia sp. S171]|uniref:hypothetical protein n=1 Tax=Burkholderia sp. S171 TaxID=1641860 RepID=UPI00131B24B3|nr:hypothetical protein [Burkholderia sp. S171]
MGLFDRNTLTQHETIAIATLIISAEIQGLFDNAPVSRVAHSSYLGDILRSLKLDAGKPKTLSATRQRAMVNFVSLAVRELAKTVPAHQLRYLVSLTLSCSALILSDISRCPQELVDWYEAVSRELRRNKLV